MLHQRGFECKIEGVVKNKDVYIPGMHHFNCQGLRNVDDFIKVLLYFKM